MLLQMGSTGAVIFVVMVFLNHMKEESKLNREVHKHCEEKIAASSALLIEVISENTKAFIEVRDILRQQRAA